MDRDNRIAALREALDEMGRRVDYAAVHLDDAYDPTAWAAWLRVFNRRITAFERLAAMLDRLESESG